MHCATCSAEMAESQRGGVTVEVCAACGACWSTRSGLQAVIDGVERRFTAKSLADLRAECAERRRAPAVQAGTVIHYLKCPDCGVQMHRKAIAGDSGIVADVCAPHGILLKKGQLDALCDHVARGGELLMLEARIQQLSEELADLGRQVRNRERIKASPADGADVLPIFLDMGF